MTTLNLTPEMAEHARWIEAGVAETYDRLAARRRARMGGQVYVAGHYRRKV